MHSNRASQTSNINSKTGARSPLPPRARGIKDPSSPTPLYYNDTIAPEIDPHTVFMLGRVPSRARTRNSRSSRGVMNALHPSVVLFFYDHDRPRVPRTDLANPDKNHRRACRGDGQRQGRFPLEKLCILLQTRFYTVIKTKLNDRIRESRIIYIGQ